MCLVFHSDHHFDGDLFVASFCVVYSSYYYSLTFIFLSSFLDVVSQHFLHIFLFHLLLDFGRFLSGSGSDTDLLLVLFLFIFSTGLRTDQDQRVLNNYNQSCLQ